MTSYSDLVFVKLISEPGETPTAFQSRHNAVVGVPPDLVSPIPFDGTKVRLYDMWGFFRDVAGTVEYVMSDRVNPAARQALNQIPGTDGWRVAASRATFRRIGLEMLIFGHTEQQVLSWLTDLYGASSAEVMARQP